MTKDEFLSKLNDLSSMGNAGVLVFFALKSSTLLKANINDDVEKHIRHALQNRLKLLHNNYFNLPDFDVKKLSEADDRSSVVYIYDVDDDITIKKHMCELKEHQEPDFFTKENDRLFMPKTPFEDIDMVFYKYGTQENHIYMCRKIFSINVMKKGTFLFRTKDIIESVNDDLLKLDDQVDFMQVNEDLLVLNLKILERFESYTDLITKEAATALNNIAKINLIDNIQELKDLASGNVAYARKIKRLEQSPVMKQSKKTIIKFIKKHPVLSKLLKIQNDKIILDGKKSKDALLSMLNDEYLHSELTNSNYKAPSKDILN